MSPTFKEVHDHSTPPPSEPAMLLLPRLRVQNANAISSPLTWGFPAISAFLGFMTALERRLGTGSGIAFRAVGVVCHNFEAQVTRAGYTKAFHLTRNPVLADGSTAGIVEEGRIHLEVSLVFGVQLSLAHIGEPERQALAQRVAEAAAGMRLAGGSIMPPLPQSLRRRPRPMLELLDDDADAQRQQFRRLMRRCLPGFALVSRDDLLQSRLAELQAQAPDSTALDAWLDLSRWNYRAVQVENSKGGGHDERPLVEWQTDQRQGWTVPIPVGYAALSELYPPGAVASARDGHTPFRFVESLWSMGQWVSPHRLKGLSDLLWYTQVEGAADASEPSLYRCHNDYQPAAETAIEAFEPAGTASPAN